MKKMNTIRKTTPAVQRSICSFGATEVGVAVSSVIANKCPNIHVCIVDFNEDQVMQWDERKIAIRDRDLQEMFQKCHKENLSFMVDARAAILAAEIIFLMIDVPNSRSKKIPELKGFEDAARLIADTSASNKIIVQKCANVPFGACEILKTILNATKSKNTRFHILTMPEFFTMGSVMSSLLNPEFIFLGHDITPDGEKAANIMTEIYSRWVPKQKIKLMNNWSAELSKILVNALIAQRLITIGSLAALCEQSGKDVFELTKIFKTNSVTDGCLDLSYSVGDINLKRDIMKLVHMCRKNKFCEVADYWKEILNQDDYQEKRFKKKILSAFYNTLKNKKFVIFGVTFKTNGKIVSELPAIKLTASLLEEGARLSLHEPELDFTREHVIDALKELGVTDVQDRLSVVDDPYRAAEKANGLIFCNKLKEFKVMDFGTIYKDMLKPAYIFDGHRFLDHEYLMQLGYKIKTIGREY